MFIRTILLLTTLLFAISAVPAQHLKRRVLPGFRPIPVNDSIAGAAGLDRPEGLLVGQIFPNGTFSAIGARQGDILLRLDGHTTNDFPALMAATETLTANAPLTATVLRDGKTLKLEGIAAGKPREASTDRYEVIYDEAPFDGGYLRTILTRPKSPGPHPVIYFIPGYNCASIDNPHPIHPYRKLFDTLANLGYVLFRIEKPGVGDGPHPCKCIETGFDKELQVFETGYRQLARYDFIDREKVFLFGHSMGGVQAPLLVAREAFQPRGIAVYGTVFQSWYEYILAMLRFQEPRTGEDYVKFEEDMQEYVRMFYRHYVEQAPLAEIIANPRWKALLERDFALSADGDLLWRRAFYWRELARRNLTAAWAKTSAHVLSIYGEADFEVFNAFSMSEIARIVNARHPGKGSFRSIPGTDHSMIDVGGMEQGIALRGKPEYRQLLITNFNYAIVTALDDWIREVLRAGN